MINELVIYDLILKLFVIILVLIFMIFIWLKLSFRRLEKIIEEYQLENLKFNKEGKKE